MAEKIIRSPELIPGATLECLLLSLREFTGQPIKHFGDRATVERRLEMAMLAASDATAHAGVPKGTTKIIPKTMAELGITVAPDEDEPPAPREVKTDWGGMVKKLEDIELTPTPTFAERRAAARRDESTIVRATGRGTSKLQSASIRAAVMKAIASEPAGVPMARLDAAFPPSARGHVQKLIAANHVEVVKDDKQ